MSCSASSSAAASTLGEARRAAPRAAAVTTDGANSAIVTAYSPSHVHASTLARRAQREHPTTPQPSVHGFREAGNTHSCDVGPRITQALYAAKVSRIEASAA